MEKTDCLPESYEEVKSLDKEERNEMWLRYFKEPPSTTSPRINRIMWYKIQCERDNISIEQKNITRLNRYAKDPDKYIKKATRKKYKLKSGIEIVKKYKGKEYRVKVISEKEFIYNNQSYQSLSAAANAICGLKVSGNNFFGLDKKNPNNSAEEEESE